MKNNDSGKTINANSFEPQMQKKMQDSCLEKMVELLTETCQYASSIIDIWATRPISQENAIKTINDIKTEKYISYLIELMDKKHKELTSLKPKMVLKEKDVYTMEMLIRNISTIRKEYAKVEAQKKIAITPSVRCKTYKSIIESTEIPFSGEEENGRCVDFVIYHQKFQTLVKDPCFTYIQYLDNLVNGKVKVETKAKEDVREYYQSLHGYLIDYISRTMPLLGAQLKRFNWEKKHQDAQKIEKVENLSEKIDGNEVINYCNVCKKEFANENVYKYHFQGKKHKHLEKSISTCSDENNESLGMEKLIFEIKELLLILKPKIQDTRKNVIRKLNLTKEERFIDLECNEKNSESVEEESDDQIYESQLVENPKNIPLGWDGNPIPYWLYKLNGLDKTFNCEICSNHVYKGKSIYTEHFKEARHTKGLECLGISNSRVFHGIADIKSAKRLWVKVKEDLKKKRLGSHGVEELEDTDGNIYPRKVYEDLRRQGLI